MAWRGIRLELETYVATLWGMKGGGVGQSVRGEIERKQRHVPTGVNDGVVIVVQFGRLTPHVR